MNVKGNCERFENLATVNIFQNYSIKFRWKITMCGDYINSRHSHLYPDAVHNTLLTTVVDHLSLNLKIFKEKEVNIEQFVLRYIHNI